MAKMCILYIFAYCAVLSSVLYCTECVFTVCAIFYVTQGVQMEISKTVQICCKASFVCVFLFVLFCFLHEAVGRCHEFGDDFE